MSAINAWGLIAPGSIHTFVAAGDGGGGAARGVASRLEAELAGGTQVEQPGRQHPLVDEGAAAVGDALAVERLGAQSARPGRVVHDGDRLGEDHVPSRAFRKLVPRAIEGPEIAPHTGEV